MSGEQLTAKELNGNLEARKFKSGQSRVDINQLLSELRKKEIRQKKENYMFVGLICGVVVVTGIIASL